MTDPELADATYIEPITPEIVAKIIEKERYVVPGGFALLPTMGADRAELRALAAQAGHAGEIRRRDDRCHRRCHRQGEDRGRFRQAMTKIGLETPRSVQTKTLPTRCARSTRSACPPSSGRPSPWRHRRRHRLHQARVHRNRRARHRRLSHRRSPDRESVLGWKEFEMEVVRDKKDNCIIICSIENLDPMGVHTGDSITVAPALTLTTRIPDHARRLAGGAARDRVETGGSNVQFGSIPPTAAWS